MSLSRIGCRQIAARHAGSVLAGQTAAARPASLRTVRSLSSKPTFTVGVPNKSTASSLGDPVIDGITHEQKRIAAARAAAEQKRKADEEAAQNLPFYKRVGTQAKRQARQLLMVVFATASTFATLRLWEAKASYEQAIKQKDEQLETQSRKAARLDDKRDKMILLTQNFEKGLTGSSVPRASVERFLDDVKDLHGIPRSGGAGAGGKDKPGQSGFL